jgi:protein O-GlcNAc transferase
MQLIMTPKEIDLLKNYVSNASSYFEYGCGGSTVLVNSYPNIKRMVSIDSCLEWIKKTKEQISDSSKVNFYYVDINGNCTGWGAPVDNSKKSDWIKYPNSILEQKENFDLVLVDGRFRVACCTAAAIKMSKDSILLLHDCERYKDIPLKKIDQVESLAVYIKKDIEEKELINILNQNKHDYS